MQPFSYTDSNLHSPQLITIRRAGYNGSPTISNFMIKRDASYPYCNIHTIVDGSGELVFEGQTYALKKGDMFLLGAFKEHQYRTNTDDPFVLQWMEFSGGLDLVTEFIKRRECPVIETASHPHLLYQFENILTLIQKKEPSIFTQSKDIYAFLIDCLAIYAQPIHMNTKQLMVKRVMDYVENSNDTAITTLALAQLAGYNEGYFIKLFKELTGQTPYQILTQSRHHKARHLLITTELSIAEIAAKIFYYDTSHFIKDFKRSEGLTPSEFRQESRMYE